MNFHEAEWFAKLFPDVSLPSEWIPPFMTRKQCKFAKLPPAQQIAFRHEPLWKCFTCTDGTWSKASRASGGEGGPLSYLTWIDSKLLPSPHPPSPLSFSNLACKHLMELLQLIMFLDITSLWISFSTCQLYQYMTGYHEWHFAVWLVFLLPIKQWTTTYNLCLPTPNPPTPFQISYKLSILWNTCK